LGNFSVGEFVLTDAPIIARPDNSCQRLFLSEPTNGILRSIVPRGNMRGMKRSADTPTIPALSKRLVALSIAERRELAKRAGVPYNTVHKYAYRASANARFSIVTKLWNALS
jgi:hypothetical protein